MTPPTHVCPYPGCDLDIGHADLACAPHWYTVSKPTRDRVWAAYRNGTRAEHVAAIQDAIDEMRQHAEARA